MTHVDTRGWGRGGFQPCMPWGCSLTNAPSGGWGRRDDLSHVHSGGCTVTNVPNG